MFWPFSFQRFCCASALVLFSLLLARTAGAQNPGDFTIVVLPDTQNYSQTYPQIFSAQTQWVANNAASQNIQLVIGEGDIVNVGTSATQWTNASTSIGILDSAGIPYIEAIGNHDYDTLPPVDPNRGAVNFNQYFGPTRYAGKTYYGATNYPSGSNENFYGTFTWGGRSYLVLSLEFIPRAGALAWAKSVLDANPDKEVIVVTHSYLYSDGTTVDQCDTDDMRGDYNGSMLWNALISQYPNISVVVSGHITNKFFARRDDIGVNGNFVHEIFANWQDWTNGGNGYLRIMQFSPLNNTITVQSYSPYTGALLTDLGDQFTLKWHNDLLPGSGTATVNGIVRNMAYGISCEPIAGATVTVGGVSATSDSTGHFSLAVPPGQVTATASADGWQTASQSATLNDYFPNELDFFLQSTAPCPQSTVDPSVTICTPANNANVTSPVNVIAGSNSTFAVLAMDVWLDGTHVYGIGAPQVNTNVTMANGTHQLTVQGRNAAGQVFKQTLSLTAGTPPPPPPGGSCAPSPTVPSVNICTPANNSSVTSPFEVSAAGNMANPIASMQLWLDGAKYFQVAGSTLDTKVTAAAGTHRLVLQAVDNTGATVKQTIYVTVGSATPPPSGNCSPSATVPSVNICTPANNASVTSPFEVSAAGNMANPIANMQIWLDGTKYYQVAGSTLDTQVTAAAGTHRVVVQAVDTTGATVKQTIYVTVGP